MMNFEFFNLMLWSLASKMDLKLYLILLNQFMVIWMETWM